MFRTTPSVVLACLGQNACLLVLKPFEVSFAVSLRLLTYPVQFNLHSFVGKSKGILFAVNTLRRDTLLDTLPLVP